MSEITPVTIRINAELDPTVEVSSKSAASAMRALRTVIASIAQEAGKATGSVTQFTAAVSGLAASLGGIPDGSKIRELANAVRALTGALKNLANAPVGQVQSTFATLSSAVDTTKIEKAAKDLRSLSAALRAMQKAPTPAFLPQFQGNMQMPTSIPALPLAELVRFVRQLNNLDTAITRITPGIATLRQGLWEIGSNARPLMQTAGAVKELATDINSLVTALRALNRVPKTSSGGGAAPSVPGGTGGGSGTGGAGGTGGSGGRGTGAYTAVPKELKQEVSDFQSAVSSLQGAIQGASALAFTFGSAMTGVGLGLAVVGKSLIDRAAEFELYEIKLQTVLHSTVLASQRMREAVVYAARTPFNVQEVVDATVQLEVYGLKSKEILPYVANLAAGMGKEMQNTGLVVAKALSGSLDGFRSLRNQYGITTAKLHEYGAAIDSQGRLMIRTSGQLEKVRDAFKRIIDLNFSDAIQRQMGTFKGIFSNAEDAVIRLSVQLGNTLLPAAKSAVLAFTRFIEVLEKTPQWMKDLVAWGGAATAAFSLVGGGALLAAAGVGHLSMSLISMVSQLQIFSSIQKGVLAGGLAQASLELKVLTDWFGKAKAAAIAFFTANVSTGVASLTLAGVALAGLTYTLGQFGQLTPEVQAVLYGLSAFALVLPHINALSAAIDKLGASLFGLISSNPWLFALIVAAAAIGAVVYKLRDYEAQHRELQKAIADTARKERENIREFQTAKDILRDAFGMEVKTSIKNIATEVDNLAEVMLKASAIDLFKALQAKGYSTFQDISEKAKAVQDQLKEAEATQKGLQSAFQRYEQWRGKWGGYTGGKQYGVLDRPGALFGSWTPEEQAALKAANVPDQEMWESSAAFAQRLGAALQGVSSQIPALQFLQNLWSPAKDKAYEFKQVLEGINLEFQALKDFASFADKLGNFAAQSQKIQVLTNLRNQKAAELSEKFRMPTDQTGLLNILSDGSQSQSAKEAAKAILSIDAEITESIRRDRRRRIEILQTTLDRQEELYGVDYNRRLNYNQQMRDIANEGQKDVELDAEQSHKRQVILKQQFAALVAAQKEFVSSHLTASRQYISDKKNLNELSLKDEENALRRMLQFLRDYMASHAELLKKSPELRKMLRDQTLELGRGLQTNYRNQHAENYKQIQDAEARYLEQSEAMGTRSIERKIADEKVLLAYDEEAFRRRSITADQYAKLRQAHSKKIYEYEREYRKKEVENEAALNKARMDRLGSELTVRMSKLKEQFEEGEDVQGKIVEAVKARLAIQIAEIEGAAAKEVALAGNSEQEKRFQAEKTAILKRKLFDEEVRNLEDLLKKSKEHEKVVADVIVQKRPDRVGGTLSPMYGPEEDEARKKAALGNSKQGAGFYLPPFVLPSFNSQGNTPPKSQIEELIDKLKEPVSALDSQIKLLAGSITGQLAPSINNLAAAISGRFGVGTGGTVPSPRVGAPGPATTAGAPGVSTGATGEWVATPEFAARAKAGQEQISSAIREARSGDRWARYRIEDKIIVPESWNGKPKQDPNATRIDDGYRREPSPSGGGGPTSSTTNSYTTVVIGKDAIPVPQALASPLRVLGDAVANIQRSPNSSGLLKTGVS